MDKEENVLVQQLYEENWDAIAHALITFDIKLDNNGNEGRRLKKELGIIKHILYEHIKWNRDGNLHAFFFVGAVKTIRTMEKKFDRSNETRREFLVFLKLLLEKMKTQRLYVKKPMEMRHEFKKMKGVVEDESNTL
jgi:hypothetical protein